MALELWISVDLSMLDKRNSFGLLHCYMQTSQIVKVTSSLPLHNVGLYALQFLKIAVSWYSCLGSNCRTLVEHSVVEELGFCSSEKYILKFYHEIYAWFPLA